MRWRENSIENLLPLSENRVNFMQALREWVYTGDMFDAEIASEVCELCNHPEIRYQFRISNRYNSNELLVGSECINKFEIAALDENGDVLDYKASRKKVQHDRRILVTEAKKRRLFNTLIKLKKNDDTFDIESFITYVQDRGAFTPKQLSLLLWRLETYKIEYCITDFKLTIRRNREKEQLLRMADWKVKKIWQAMSTNQRNWYTENT